MYVCMYCEFVYMVHMKINKLTSMAYVYVHVCMCALRMCVYGRHEDRHVDEQARHGLTRISAAICIFAARTYVFFVCVCVCVCMHS